jgi:predicted nucleic acid-binding protein
MRSPRDSYSAGSPKTGDPCMLGCSTPAALARPSQPAEASLLSPDAQFWVSEHSTHLSQQEARARRISRPSTLTDDTLQLQFCFQKSTREVTFDYRNRVYL